MLKNNILNDNVELTNNCKLMREENNTLLSKFNHTKD